MTSTEFRNMRFIPKLVYIVATLGLLNWTTFKLLDYNFIDKLLSFLRFSSYSNWIYGGIGVFGLYALYKIFK